MVAVAWQVYLITGSSVAVGIIGLVELVPLIGFSLIGGSIADSMDRRKLMAWMQCGLMASSLGLALVSLSENPSVLWLYGFTAFSSGLQAIDGPARSATMGEIVSRSQQAAAAALHQVVFQVTMLVGPVLGGAMIASFDLSLVYLIDALTFLATLAALWWVPVNRPGVVSSSRLESIREGVKFIFRTPVLLSIFAIDLVAMIFGMPRAVFPELAKTTFGLGASGLGLLYAAPAAGALIAVLTSGWVARIREQGVAVIVSVVVWGSAIALAGVSVGSLSLTLFFLALAGAADVISAVFRRATLQTVTPRPLLGRANAAYLTVVTGGPRIGDAEAGLAAGLVGAQGSVILGGVACLAGTAVIAFKMPALRRYRVDD